MQRQCLQFWIQGFHPAIMKCDVMFVIYTMNLPVLSHLQHVLRQSLHLPGLEWKNRDNRWVNFLVSVLTTLH